MSTSINRILELVKKVPCDLIEFQNLLSNDTYTEDELMKIAIVAVDAYEFQEMDTEYRAIDPKDRDWCIKIYKAYEEAYVEEIKNHPLIQMLKLLIDKGLNPNTCIEAEEKNVMALIPYVDKPFLAGFCLKLLMEEGANPWIEIRDREYLFEEMDSNICIDINLLPDDMVQSWIHCWFVMIGYGGRPRRTDPFKLSEGHSYDELKEFVYFDWHIKYDQDKKENIMHIVDIRTGEEIGFL